MNNLYCNSNLFNDRNMARVRDAKQLTNGCGAIINKHGLPPCTHPTESLLGMALYDFDSIANDTGITGGSRGTNSASWNGQLDGTAPAFHPVDEYKDLSLKEILSLSDDFLSSEYEGNACHLELFEPVPLLGGDLSVNETQRHLQQQHLQLLHQQQQLQMIRYRQMQLRPNSEVHFWSRNFNNNMLPSANANTTDHMNFPDEEFSNLIFSNNEEALPGNFVSADTVGVGTVEPVLEPMEIKSSSVSTDGSDRPCISNHKKRAFASDIIPEGTDEDDSLDVVDFAQDGDDSHCDRRFRPYQAGQWSEKFEELCQYREKMGHCLVPHTYTENLALARWVKRQRYQYKLMVEGKSSTITEERVKALEEIGFVWDSQGAAWGDRMHELQLFKNEFNHCNVPSNYYDNPRLATWVKCQRRQYKLFMDNKPSNMTPQRIHYLEKMGFEWELRKYKKTRTSN